MSWRQRGAQFLSIILALAMVAFVNVPMIAWGVDEPVEPTQSGDVTQAAPIPDDNSQAPDDGVVGQVDPAPESNATPDDDSAATTDSDATAKTDVDATAKTDVVDSNLDAVTDNDAAPMTNKKLAVAPVVTPTEVTAPADSSSDAVSVPPDGYKQDGTTVAISTAEGLAWLASVVNGLNGQIAQTLEEYMVTLENNIDLAGEPWTPIGTESHPFMGTFDGKGKTISNLAVNTPGSSYAGLFGIIKTPASIQNVTINNASVTAKSKVGALAGSAYTGAVSSCVVTGHIEIQGNYKVGGLAGEGYAAITACSVVGDAGSFIKGSWIDEKDFEGDNVGGLLGYTGEGTPTDRINGCTVSDVSVSGTRKVGGMLGYLHYGVQVSGSTVENVSVTCDLTGDPGYLDGNDDTSGIGGLIGVVHGKNGGASDAGSMTNCKVQNTNLHVGETPAMAGYFYGKLRNTSEEPKMENCRASGCTGSTVNKDTTDHKGSDGFVPVAKIGDKEYASLADAFTAAIDNDTITLVSDIEVNDNSEASNVVTYSGGETITVDFDGHTVIGNTTNAVFSVAGSDSSESTVTLKNGVVTAGSEAYCTVIAKKIENGDAATVNIEGMTLNNSKQYGNSIKAIKGTTINVNNTAVNSTNGAGGTEAEGGTVNIVDCAYNQSGHYDWNSVNVAVSNGGTATIDDGTYISENYGAYVFNSGGTINIKGGTFESGKAVLKADTSPEAVAPSVINVSGGNFSGAYGIQDGTLMSITGGTFSVNPSEYVVDGYKAELNADGTYTVIPALPVAQVGDIKYTSLKEAIDKATNGQTVTMLNDVVIDATTIFPDDKTEDLDKKFYSTIKDKNITFDLAGKKVTLDMSELAVTSGSRRVTERGLFYIASGGGLTITDSGSNGTITAIAPEGTYSGRALIESHGTFTFVGGTVRGVENVYYLVSPRSSAAHTTIKGGTLENTWGDWSSGGVCVASNGTKGNEGYTIDISGGTLKGGPQVFYLPSAGTTTITGGTFEGIGRVVEIFAGVLNVTGGTFTATEERHPGTVVGDGTTDGPTGALVAVNPKSAKESGYAGDIKINVSGGTFTDTAGDAITVINEQTSNPLYTMDAHISGGTFTGGMNIGDTVSESGTDILSITAGTFKPVVVDTKYYDENIYSQNAQDTADAPGAVVPRAYTLSYYLANGTLPDGATNPTSYTYFDNDFTLVNPTKAGYTFAGWTGAGIEGSSKNVTITKNSTDDRSYTATWTANEARIAFEENGGPAVSDIVGKTGETVTGSLPTPTREGYTFAGWYADKTLATQVTQLPATFPAGTTTYYAKWTAVSLPDDPTIEVEVPQPSEGDSSYVTVPDEAVEAAVEQAKDALATIEAGGVPSGMDPQDAKAVADLIESAAPDDTVSVVVSLGFKEQDPAKVDGDEKTAIDGVSEGGEEVALYLDLSVSMTVKVSDSSGIKNQKIVSLDEVKEPLLFEVHVDPALIQGKSVRIAHVHNGATEVIYPESVDRERGIISFYASSFSTYALLTSETVTVTFESNGGTTVDPQTLKFGEKASKPADPTRTGFVFGGWFSDKTLEQAYDFATPVENSITLYAKWTQNSTIKKLAATGDATGTLATGAMALTVIAGAALGVAALRRRRSR